MSSTYYLSPHTFVCLSNGHYVFLDLKNDDYLCLRRAHTDAVRDVLGHEVVNNGVSTVDRRAADCDAMKSEIVRELVKSKLLVEDPSEGKEISKGIIDAPVASLIDQLNSNSPAIGAREVRRFFLAAIEAAVSLRYRSLERTVRRIEERKTVRNNESRSVDGGTLVELFHVFQTLRPFYPRPYLCLFDSLAYLNFLSRYNLFPTWVYGVKVEPFFAHCWVQAGDKVINDSMHRVRDYTPIMAI